MRGLLQICLALAILVCGAVLLAAAPQPAATVFSTDVSVQPGPDGSYLLRAKVADADSGEVLAGPGLKLPAGQSASTESTLEDSETVVSLNAAIDGANHSATYTVKVTRGKKLLSSHSARVAL